MIVKKDARHDVEKIFIQKNIYVQWQEQLPCPPSGIEWIYARHLFPFAFLYLCS